MKSLSKIPLSAGQAQAIITHTFGSGRRLLNFSELQEGYFNTAALLELDDGQRLVLKAAPPPDLRVLGYEKDILLAEVQALELVRRQTGVHVPAVVQVDTSRRLLQSDYFLMEFLPGVPFHKLRSQFTPAEQAAVERSMGAMTRQISAVTGPAFGYLAQPAPPGASWRECFSGMLQGVIQDGIAIGVRLPLPYPDLVALLEAHFDALDEVRQPRLVHWDLWDGNVFVDPATRQVTGLIDFERALWGDPLMEAIFRVPNPHSSFMAGFGSNLLETPAQLWRRRLYNAYLYLIMIIECPYRQYETDDQERWTRGQLDRLLIELEE